MKRLTFKPLALRWMAAVLAIASLNACAPLVLGSAAVGNPGPLVSHFSSAGIGALSCPLYLVPGGLDEAAIDRLS